MKSQPSWTWYSHPAAQNKGGDHFIANSRQTLPPFSVQQWPPQVQYFQFNRLSQQIMSLCFACITQCHLLTLKRGLFGSSAALLSWEWVVNCQGACLCVFAETQCSVIRWHMLFSHNLCFNKQRQKSSRRGLEGGNLRERRYLGGICVWCYFSII